MRHRLAAILAAVWVVAVTGAVATQAKRGAATRDLVAAVRRGDGGEVAAALGRGADPNCWDALPADDGARESWFARADAALRGRVAADENVAQGRTVLMRAASQGDLSAVSTLLEAGADPAATDRLGGTAYDYVWAAHWAALPTLSGREVKPKHTAKEYRAIERMLMGAMQAVGRVRGIHVRS